MLDDFLKVKRSTLPKSGKGVFTTVDIKKGDVITELKGENYTSKDFDLMIHAEPNRDGYAFYVNRNKVIDTFNALKEPSRYINDAKGITRVKGLTNNCEFSVKKKRVFVIATKNIQKGSELFVSYGPEYWEARKQQ